MKTIQQIFDNLYSKRECSTDRILSDLCKEVLKRENGEILKLDSELFVFSFAIVKEGYPKNIFVNLAVDYIKTQALIEFACKH